ncbi:helix-turn-helix domain-containing protein [Staphylococcus ratti]|uniref:Helix-turn-helix transcriptional regulator n=1 Tax=Staphylococcus ratti TaxID=2892440 RepID=A0ABY3PCV2_9STAP|nr:helix-turn-helix transcriptional regulator [Staphylococcus ratti]UEX90159.1 helix-turn-helix transcriptional regulator [Staphylococcus ratti]
MIQINQTIKRERLRCGMTQDNLAEHLNITKTTISKWENGILYPDITLLPKLAKIFNITVDELLNYKKTLNNADIRKISLKLTQMIPQTSYKAYLLSVKAHYIDHANEFKFLNSLLGVLANNILYCDDEILFKETLSLARSIIKTTEDNCDDVYLKKHAQVYKTMLYAFEGDFESVINATPDFDLKLGEHALLTRAYLQQGNHLKAKNVLHTDMYQSLMILMYDFSLMLTHELYTTPIETLELKFYHLNQALNVDDLYPYVSINCYFQFALYYAKKDDQKAETYLNKYCDCFEYLVKHFIFQKDDFFTHIDAWIETLPLGEKLPANYENMLKTLLTTVLENAHFTSLNGFEPIKHKLLNIYNQRGITY